MTEKTKADFIKAEELIRLYFKIGTKFRMESTDYVVKVSGKPLPQKGKGEPKTDIYVLAESVSSKEKREIKISYKKENAEFLENKMSASRTEQIFGPAWADVVKKCTKSVRKDFKNSPLIYYDKYKKTNPGAMTIGWRFELFNVSQGDRSGLVKNMPMDQVYEVYAGAKLEERKKNAKVNGQVVPGSGVADYILISDSVRSAQDVIDNMCLISEYIKDHPDIYFACKALNYRSKEKKIEGARALAVQVDWAVKNDKLVAKLNFNNPLTRKGTEMKKIAAKCLKDLNKNDATELTDEEISNFMVYKK